MKAVFTLVSVLAIAHLLAVGGFVGWLVGTDRLDADRLEQIRELLESPPEPEDDGSDQSDPGGQIRQTSGPALSAEEQLAMRLDEEAIVEQRRRLAGRAISDLRAAFERDIQKLAEERAQFEAQRQAFEERIERIEQIDGSEQFRKSVALIERLDPADAAQILRSLLEGQAPPEIAGLGASAQGADSPEDRIEGVVSYLNAMSERKRAGVMAEVVAEDPGLAAVLLERLRTRGVESRASELDPDEP